MKLHARMKEYFFSYTLLIGIFVRFIINWIKALMRISIMEVAVVVVSLLFHLSETRFPMSYFNNR